MRAVQRIAFVTIISLASTAASAQDASDELARTVAEQKELIERLSTRIEQLDSRLAELEAQLNASVPATGEEPTPQERSIITAETVPAPEDALVLELTEEERREQERLVRAAFQRTLIERGGLLLPPGTIDFQPAISHLHSSADNIVIDGFTILPVLVVGDIVSERVERSLSQLSTTFRFGLPWDSQLEIRVPYSDHDQRSFSADNVEATRGSSDFGDLEIGLSRQLVRSQGLWPDLLGSVRWKTTTGTSPFDIDPDTELSTGTGYDSLNLGITAVKVVDPVVYFGSLSYSRNLETTERIGRFDPGDSLGFSLGMALALNLNGSLSFSYDHQRTQRTKIDGTVVPGSYLTTGMFTIGASFALNDSIVADLSLGLGVTSDSPDIQLGASLPIRWRR